MSIPPLVTARTSVGSQGQFTADRPTGYGVNEHACGIDQRRTRAGRWTELAAAVSSSHFGHAGTDETRRGLVMCCTPMLEEKNAGNARVPRRTAGLVLRVVRR